MVKRGKRYSEALSIQEDDKEYEPLEAIDLAKKSATAKFDETVELHLRTNADPRQADQLVRGVAVLPHGLGKPVRVVVFVEGEAVGIAREAGADFVGSDDLVKKVEGGWTEFDVSIATPDMMSRVGKLGRVLGRKGLMPNPKTGTVVQSGDVGRAVSEVKKGRVEYRLDKSSLIHVSFGKASFEASQLMDNLTSVMDNIVRSRPSGVKGEYIRSAFLTTTMGPSIRLDVTSTSELKIE
jgi:large subunit ribosomal protein L1